MSDIVGLIALAILLIAALGITAYIQYARRKATIELLDDLLNHITNVLINYLESSYSEKANYINASRERWGQSRIEDE